MKTVVILYEHVSREYEMCARLKNALESEENDVYLYSLHFQIGKVYELALKKKIDLLIVPYAYKEQSLIRVMMLIKHHRVKAIFNLRQEQIGSKFNEHRFYPFDEFTRKKIFHSAWTEYFKNEMLRRGIPEKHVVLTHNPRTDLLFETGSVTRDECAGLYGLDPKKKWLLISESGGVMSQALINRRIELGYNEQDLYELNDVMSRGFAETERQLKELSDDFFDEYEVIYRPHPGSKCQIQIGERIHVIDKESVYYWLNYVDVVISRISTALYEAQGKGIPALRYIPVPIDKKFWNFGFEYLPTINEIEELHGKDLTKYVGNTYLDYIGPVDGNSIQILASELKKILAADTNDFADYELHTKLPYRRHAVRSVLSNAYSYLVYRFSLDQLKRFSGSMTVLENDVPPEWRDKACCNGK